MTNVYPEDVIAEIRRSWSRGETRDQIAQRLGVSRSTVYAHTRDIARAMSWSSTFTAEDLSWQDDAVCAGTDVNSFVTDHRDAEANQAMRLCTGCPVREQCLDFGIRTGSEGVWGGRWLNSHNREQIAQEAA